MSGQALQAPRMSVADIGRHEIAKTLPVMSRRRAYDGTPGENEAGVGAKIPGKRGVRDGTPAQWRRVVDSAAYRGWRSKRGCGPGNCGA